MIASLPLVMFQTEDRGDETVGRFVMFEPNGDLKDLCAPSYFFGDDPADRLAQAEAWRLTMMDSFKEALSGFG